MHASCTDGRVDICSPSATRSVIPPSTKKTISNFLIYFVFSQKAAHCLQTKDEKSGTSPKYFRLLLGGHDLKDDFEEGRMFIGVKKYKVHSDWDLSTVDYEGDIAVILLNIQAPISRYIRPICLSESNVLTNMNSGTLAGWGYYDDSKNPSNLPRKIDLDIISNKECFKRDRSLKLVSADGMFCAGKEGVAVCSGDSGSGLYVNINGKFYLRGLVSAAKQTECSRGYLALYTDVMNYLDFISMQLRLLKD